MKPDPQFHRKTQGYGTIKTTANYPLIGAILAEKLRRRDRIKDYEPD